MGVGVGCGGGESDLVNQKVSLSPVDPKQAEVWEQAELAARMAAEPELWDSAQVEARDSDRMEVRLEARRAWLAG